ncbi:MAG TPA: thioredoxin family protein [Ignavibacteriaceae bacterium]|jgi:peroxiredoxin|nr:thioredoxin family protein [Ignavibacteriaceae bacterium]
MLKYIFTLAAVILFLTNISAQIKIDAEAPKFTLKDSNGKEHSLNDFEGKYVVLEWINFDCPFVKKHYNSDNMQTLQKEYVGKDVVWLLICSSAEGKQGHFSNNEINKRLKALGANATAYLIDEDGKVGKKYGAKTTPHMFVINPEGKLIYAGAIDDKPSTDVDDIDEAVNYVREALNASLAGNAVKVKTSTPYGCSVKY